MKNVFRILLLQNPGLYDTSKSGQITLNILNQITNIELRLGVVNLLRTKVVIATGFSTCKEILHFILKKKLQECSNPIFMRKI